MKSVFGNFSCQRYVGEMLTEVKTSFGTEPFDHDSRLSDKRGDSYSDARSFNDALGRGVEMQVCIWEPNPDKYDVARGCANYN